MRKISRVKLAVASMSAAALLSTAAAGAAAAIPALAAGPDVHYNG